MEFSYNINSFHQIITMEKYIVLTWIVELYNHSKVSEKFSVPNHLWRVTFATCPMRKQKRDADSTWATPSFSPHIDWDQNAQI